MNVTGILGTSRKKAVYLFSPLPQRKCENGELLRDLFKDFFFFKEYGVLFISSNVFKFREKRPHTEIA